MVPVIFWAWATALATLYGISASNPEADSLILPVLTVLLVVTAIIALVGFIRGGLK